MGDFFLILYCEYLNNQVRISNNIFFITYISVIIHLFLVLIFFETYLTGYYWLELFILIYFVRLGSVDCELFKEGLAKYFNILSLLIGVFLFLVLPLGLIVYYNNPDLFFYFFSFISLVRSLIYICFSLFIVYKVLNTPLNKESKKTWYKIGMGIGFMLLTSFITGFIGDIFSSNLTMNSMGGNGAAGGSGAGGNGAGGNGAGGNGTGLWFDPRDAIPWDDSWATKRAYDKIVMRHARGLGDLQIRRSNLFAAIPGDSANDLDLAEKEAVVSAINAYNYPAGGSNPDGGVNPRQAMIKASRLESHEGISYTNSGWKCREGELLFLNNRTDKYTNVRHDFNTVFEAVFNAVNHKAYLQGSRPISRALTY